MEVVHVQYEKWWLLSTEYSKAVELPIRWHSGCWKFTWIQQMIFENMENMHGKICKDDFCLKRAVNRKLLEIRSISERSTSAFILLWTLIVGCQRCFWLDGILVWTAVWLQSLLSLKTRAGDFYFFFNLGPFSGLFYTIAETDLLS